MSAGKPSSNLRLRRSGEQAQRERLMADCWDSLKSIEDLEELEQTRDRLRTESLMRSSSPDHGGKNLIQFLPRVVESRETPQE